MPSEVYKKFYKDLDKAAKKAEEEQKKFREAEKKLNEDYDKKREEEREFEYLNSIRQEDSTRPYNPVEHYKKGGIILAGANLDKRKKVIKKSNMMAKGGTPRIPRKLGQPVGSKKHSDLYTDENPKGTISGLKFKTETDAKKSVAKIKKSGKTRAHKIQAAVAMEQRAGVMGKASSAGVYRKFIDSAKITKKAKGGLISGKPKLALRGF